VGSIQTSTASGVWRTIGMLGRWDVGAFVYIPDIFLLGKYFIAMDASGSFCIDP
jgi:hypothetical protein